MKLSPEALTLLEKYNRNHPMYVSSYFRLFHARKDNNVVLSLAINRDSHTVSEANRIARKLKNALYADDVSLGYHMETTHQSIQPAVYTSDNKNLAELSILYIM